MDSLLTAKVSGMTAPYFLTCNETLQTEAAIFSSGMPVAALMEKAALLMTTRFTELYPTSQFCRVGVLVGSGHNGADALVMARELALAGRDVTLFLAGGNHCLKELTAAHLKVARSLKINETTSVMGLSNSDVLIDGIRGLTQVKEVSSVEVHFIESINELQKPIVAIDMPTGLSCDFGIPVGAALRARHTFCLGAYKPGAMATSALAFVGTVECIPLGLEPFIEPSKPQSNTAWRSECQFPQRRADDHKYSVGKGLIIAGSENFLGAGILAARAARLLGVGHLSIAVPKEGRDAYLAHVPDAVYISRDRISCDGFRAILCGPGLGDDRDLTRNIVAKANCPLVLDADALNALAPLEISFKFKNSATVLTPHFGEFERLFPTLSTGIKETRVSLIEAATIAATRHSCYVILKGPRTIIASPLGKAYVQMESTPLLARAGTGDVLAGFIVSLLSQGMECLEACRYAVGWHGARALDLQRTYSMATVSAFDLVASPYDCPTRD